MLFSSASFIFLFLPLLLITYFVTPKPLKNLILVIFSIVFYLFSSYNFFLILASSIVLNYFIALLIYGFNNHKYKKLFLMVGVAINLGILLYFKYFSFFLTNIANPIFGSKFNPSILVPLALSFYTFHALSYLIDAYKKKITPSKNIIRVALYFLFFPHLIAGPIVRYAEILSFFKNRTITSESLSYGILRFITGLAKKVLIADTLGSIADEIFGIPPANMATETAWLGIICFTIQIYFDFSGYSDMAIGLASIFGFKFPENFNYPYLSKSIGEFWNRWHMTLGRWFRDYLYIPLGGNRVTPLKNYFNIVFVFFMTGLWHGAGWTFIVWGLLQAFFITIERFKEGILMKHLWPPLQHFYAVLAIIIGWVFFRSENIEYAFLFLRRMFLDFSKPAVEYLPVSYFLNNAAITTLVLALLISTSVLQKLTIKIQSFFAKKQNQFALLDSVKLIYFLILFIITLMYVANQTYHPFIYFKF